MDMGRGPPRATLPVRSQILEGAGGPYFGGVEGCGPLLTPATRNTVIRVFGYAERIFLKKLSFQATLDFVKFCVLASPGDRF